MFSLIRDARKIPLAALGAAVGVAALGSTANAGVVVLGGGWQVEWDPYYDNYGGRQLIDINPANPNASNTDTIFFEKIVEFVDGPDNGVFPSVALVFSIVPGWTGQIATNLVIEDEIITNSTGSAWTDFHMDLLDHGQVQFNPTLSAGFNIAPFQNFQFTDNNTRMDIWNGVVNNGQVWQPGIGPGQLWIQVNNVSTNTVFVLKETPTPTPGALALLGLAAVFGARRRRRS